MLNKDQCYEIRELLSLYIDNELSEEEIQLVETHLVHCPACKQEYLEMLEIAELLRVIPSATIPDQFELRLKRALSEEGKQIRQDIQVKETVQNKKINWRMMSSIAAVFVVGIISYVSFADIQILPLNINGASQEGTSYSVDAPKENKLVVAKKNKQVTSNHIEDGISELSNDSMNSNSRIESKEQTKSIETKDINLDVSPDENVHTSSDNTLQYKSFAPMEDIDVRDMTKDDNEFNNQPYFDISNKIQNITSTPIKLNNDESKEYYKEMIAKKFDGFDYKITSSVYKDNGQWNFIVFIFNGKDDNIINKEIEVVGKGRQIEVLYADEFMGL